VHREAPARNSMIGLVLVTHGRLLARPAKALAGLIEVRGLGIRRLDYEPVAVIGLVVDLAISEAERLPREVEGQIVIAGIMLPRLAVAMGADPLPMVLAFHSSSDAGV